MNTYHVVSRSGVFVWGTEGSVEAPAAGTAQPGTNWHLVSRNNIHDWTAPRIGGGGGGGGFVAAWAAGSNVVICGAIQ